MEYGPINRETSLSELRSRVLAARQTLAPLPGRLGELERRHENSRRQSWNVSDVVVRNNGEIATVQETRGEMTVSRVTTQIFASRAWDEASLVRKHLPRNTTQQGHGWAYTVVNEFQDVFDLFLYWDDYLRAYRVRLLAPALEGLGAAHRLHIYSDGNLCLSPASGGGKDMLNNAYAESVLWCNGVGAVLRGHRWPWGE